MISLYLLPFNKEFYVFQNSFQFIEALKFSLFFSMPFYLNFFIFCLIVFILISGGVKKKVFGR